MVSKGFIQTSVHVTVASHNVKIDWKSDPRRPEIEENFVILAGIRFSCHVNKVESSYELLFQIAEDSVACLAKGWSVVLVNKYAYMTPNSGRWNTGSPVAEHQFSDDSKSLRICGLTQATEVTLELTVKSSNVCPYRHYFVDQEIAAIRRADCQILVEGDEEPLFVNKAILSMDSPFFYSMFNSDFREKHQDQISIGGTTKDELLEYLYCVYSPTRPLAMCRIGLVLKLADRFQNDFLMRQCEEFLLKQSKSDEVEKTEVLEWANNYRMDTLFRYTLLSMGRADLKSLDAERASQFRPQNVKMILEKALSSSDTNDGWIFTLTS